MAIDIESTPQIPLSRERVLRAAIALADRDGIEALSMRKLAAELGVKAMSLYNHVESKDDILDGITDLVVGEIELPLGADWQTAMRKRANSAREVLLRHPWATVEIVSRVNIGSAMLTYINATLGCLHEAGFSLEMADRAWNAIDSHIYGFTLQELNFPFKASEYAEVARNYLDLVPAHKYPYMNRLAHQIIDGSYNGVHDFNFGLELILNGLERSRGT